MYTLCSFDAWLLLAHSHCCLLFSCTYEAPILEYRRLSNGDTNLLCQYLLAYIFTICVIINNLCSTCLNYIVMRVVLSGSIFILLNGTLVAELT